MTITTVSNRVNTGGDGVTTLFSFTLFVEDAGDLEVWLRSNNGAEALQTISTHYTLTGLGSASVSVTMITAPASGERLVMIRKEPHTNEVAVDDVKTFRAQAFEDQFDRIARGQQIIEDEVGCSDNKCAWCKLCSCAAEIPGATNTTCNRACARFGECQSQFGAILP